MDLRELQRAFQDRVLSYQDAVEPHLAAHGKEDFEARLDTYVGGYRTRLIEALSTTYPALKAALGDAEFDAQMRRYVNSTPSRHYSVRHYGATMASQLLERFAAAQGRVLSELASWEWTLADVFDAPDDDALPLAALAAVPATAWPELTFTPRVCMRRVETHSNAVEWWRAANGLCDMPAAYRGSEAQQWVLWRRGVTTQFRSLEATEAVLWDAAVAGSTFGTLCEGVADMVDGEDAAIRAASMLKAWLTEELIADCAWPDPA
jgi:hypothetical protein